MIFVGIDVIGDYLTEINVTSPTGIQEIKRFDGVASERECGMPSRPAGPSSGLSRPAGPRRRLSRPEGRAEGMAGLEAVKRPGGAKPSRPNPWRRCNFRACGSDENPYIPR